MPRYNPAEIEPRWQNYWEQNKTFRSPEMPEGEKIYVLDMFPYPSGAGLHVGHPEGYTATDIVCRYHRMKGTSVLHPMGFDAFGLPAEEQAIRTNKPPRESTEENIDNFRRQLKMLGFSYDWDRELATTDVKYFRWTQWIFLQLFDTWFDTEAQKGRPICELPIPADVAASGDEAVRHFQDEHRLAYQADALVNWCPALGTVLANEEVTDGRSERGNHPVTRIPLRQWMLRITAYADRLENDLEQVDWSEGIKKLQRDWIGRSTGAEVDFFIGTAEESESWKIERTKSGWPKKPGEEVLRIYTTRPDTLYGATYMVIAPEHPFVDRLTTNEHRQAVTDYCSAAAAKSDRERLEEKKTKTGVFTGSFAINPVNGNPIPIWIADYVLISYGTGAIMAVPAHDTRDYEFAEQFGIDIIAVVDPGDQREPEEREAVLAGKTCFAGKGTVCNSQSYDGLATDDCKSHITENLHASGLGSQAVNYKLRDWLFSRQRFWGEPFPILHELDAEGQPNGLMRAVSESDLPVDLPHLEDYKPHGRPEPPLAKADDAWLYPVIDGVRYRRETNTMPQWAGSCWYYLRFIDPDNETCFVDPEKERAWMPVDLYIGGAEHAVLHLLYARFWHKVLYDRGHVHTPEPFHRLVNQGMILGEMEHVGYRTAEGQWVPANQVQEREDATFIRKADQVIVDPVSLDAADLTKQGNGFVLSEDPEIGVDSRSFKMSKSRGNVINPDDVVDQYGADALRLYEMFMGPLEATKPWSMAGVNGVRGFLDRAWRMITDDRAEELVLNAAIVDDPPTDEQNRWVHKTIKAVSQDIEQLSFNTAIARMMEFVNHFTKESRRPKAAMEPFVLLLSPFAPHLAEELWNVLGHGPTLAYEPWPEFDEALTQDQTVEIPVQIKGKLRAKIQVPADATKEAIESAAREEPRVQEILADQTVVKVIVVPGRMVNFVTR
jgi:leucyl-tRNA synthetase